MTSLAVSACSSATSTELSGSLLAGSLLWSAAGLSNREVSFPEDSVLEDASEDTDDSAGLVLVGVAVSVVLGAEDGVEEGVDDGVELTLGVLLTEPAKATSN